jgi:plasmid stabilization system protein ParE
MKNMAIEFIIKENASMDVIEIVDWYDIKQLGLGDRFYKDLLNEFEKIKQNPKLYSFYNKDFKRAILKHFPYLIIFKVTENEIVIYSIIYGGRNPRLINRRIN